MRHATVPAALSCALTALALLSGCAEDAAAPPPPPNACLVDRQAALPDDAPQGCDLFVAPGSDDQTAVQNALTEAWPGATVCLAAGTFQLGVELQLAASDVVVRGAGLDATVLDFTGQSVGANGLSITGDRVTLEALTVLNTAGDGVRATGVADITFRAVAVIWEADASTESGAYALYPVGCDGVLVEGCKVKGARDAGIYVGQSRDIVVRDNEVWGNVAGIEIENSFDAEVYDNHAHDNTAGILIFNLPNLPVKGGERALVRDNLIENNNLPNFAPGGIVKEVPSGIGMLILACDNNEIRGNTITGHDSTGVVIVTYHADLFGGFQDPDYDIYATGNWIHGNTFADNGASPRGILAIISSQRPMADLLVDGCVDPDAPAPTVADNPVRNCFSDTGGASYLNFDFCGGLAAQVGDVAEATCAGDALAPVTFAPPPPPADSGPPSTSVGCGKLSDFGFFTGRLADLAPAAGVLPYAPGSPLFSDYAGKARHLFLPEGTAATFAPSGAWDFPVGAVVIKTFYFPEDLRVPDGPRRIVETRLLIRTADGWIAENYHWNEAQTEALRSAAGKQVPVSYLDLEGQARQESYVVPNINQCASCHQIGGDLELLGVSTEQLNHPHEVDGAMVNRITWLAEQGAVTGAPADLSASPALPDPFGDAPLDVRARGYLHANCSHCHRPGGAAANSGLFLLASVTDPQALGICKAPPAAGAGSGGLAYDIVPGSPEESILVYRMRSTEPDIRMPELANNLVHSAGIALVEDWIRALDPVACDVTP